MTGKCSNCGHVSGTSTCHECGCIVPGIPMQLWEMGSAGGAIMADAYDKLKAEMEVRERRHAEAIDAADSELRKQRVGYEGEIERLKADLAEVRAASRSAWQWEHDQLRARAATAIALEDAVLAEKHRHDLNCPGRQRGGQPIDDCDCSCGVFASKERIRDAISASRAARDERERDCKVTSFSSRICERGTRCCVIEHASENKETPMLAPKKRIVRIPMPHHPASSNDSLRFEGMPDRCPSPGGCDEDGGEVGAGRYCTECVEAAVAAARVHCPGCDGDHS